jgi:WXG100 family type VII secretion target
LTNEIKMDYVLMDEMQRTFNEGSNQLGDTQNEMRNLASMLSDGALLGQAGSAFVDALNSQLVPAIQRLSEKFDELQGDLAGAVRDMQEADQTSKNLMG